MDREDLLAGISLVALFVFLFGILGTALFYTDEKQELEMEKLKLEIEIKKKQIQQ